MDNAERQRRLRAMLMQLAPQGQIENLSETLQAGGPAAAGERLDAARPGDDEESLALETLDVLIRDGIETPLDGDQQLALEAIIHKRYRPVVFIQNDTYQRLPPPWTELGSATVKQRLGAVIPSIGRIELPNHPSVPYGGTGFVVGENLLMTNRHVAAIFTAGLGLNNLRFHAGLTAGIDFKREQGATEDGQPLTVERVLMIHPYWDMALLRVSGLPARHKVLPLSVAEPETLKDRNVVVIGYPAQDRRNDLNLQNQIFGGVYEVKRLQPGKMQVRRDIESYGRKVSAVTHDCSTLGGNSGSAVIDVQTGQIVGLHFAGQYLDANYAVPTYELARDVRVVDAGVRFTGTVTPSPVYPPIWQSLSGSEVAATPPAAGGSTLALADPGSHRPGTTARWTIPLEISVSFGTPVLAAAAAQLAVKAAPTARPVQLATDFDAARRELERATTRPYYDAAKDATAIASYYAGITPGNNADTFYDRLRNLLTSTHSSRPSYSPSVHVYPWVDLQPNLKLKSVYSGQIFEPLEFIAQDEATERTRLEQFAAFQATEAAL